VSETPQDHWLLISGHMAYYYLAPFEVFFPFLKRAEFVRAARSVKTKQIKNIRAQVEA
jgi:hypothetical protein